MTGTDRQTFGLIYDDDPADADAYGTGNYILSRIPVAIPAGEAYTLRRRIVAADGGTGPDPFAVLAAIYRAGR